MVTMTPPMLAGSQSQKNAQCEDTRDGHDDDEHHKDITHHELACFARTWSY
jgi:hypothetical protein